MAHQLSCLEAWEIRPGIESVSPALASEFLTTGPSGKSPTVFFFLNKVNAN